MQFTLDEVDLPQLEYGLDTLYALGSLTSTNSHTNHTFILNDLPLGEPIFYRITSSNSTVLLEEVFNAHPTATQNLSFVALSDFGTPTGPTAVIAAAVRQHDPALLITAGDNVYELGEHHEYNPSLFTPYKQIFQRTPFMPIVGNHDTFTLRGQAYLDNFDLPQNSTVDGFNFSYDYGMIHFACVNSQFIAEDPTTYGAAVGAWLAADLAASSKPWKIVVTHHPIESSQAVHAIDTRVSNIIQPIVEAAGVDLVIQGHNHLYERHNPINGVHYITTGGGGRGLYNMTIRANTSAFFNNQIHSFTSYDVTSSNLTVRALDAQLQQIDALRIEKNHLFEMDGFLDPEAIDLNGFHAAVRDTTLYFASVDPAHIWLFSQIYLSDGVNTNLRSTGVNTAVADWNFRLINEHRFGDHYWRDLPPVADPLATFHSMRSGDTLSANNVWEGTVDLKEAMTNLPETIYLSRVAYSASVVAGQWPEPAIIDDDVPFSEYFSTNLVELALDFPKLADTNTLMLAAGYPAELGSVTNGYSGVDYHWTYLSGPTNLVANPTTTNSPLDYVFSTNPTSAVTFAFEVEAQDHRFTRTTRYDITFVSGADTDGDGLVDYEETTGLDLPNTYFSPEGQTTDPAIADSDGDGANDAHEIYAGTLPHDSDSTFSLYQPEYSNTNDTLHLQWTSVADHTYTLRRHDDLNQPGTIVATVAATPPMNTYDYPFNANTHARPVYFTVEVVQDAE